MHFLNSPASYQMHRCKQIFFFYQDDIWQNIALLIFILNWLNENILISSGTVCHTFGPM